MARGAVDLSNYTTNVAVPGSGTSGGLITDAHCREWIANGFTHAVIGTQWPDVAKHQLEVCHRNGMTLDLYTWLYWNRDIAKYIGDRLSLATGYPVGIHWLDAEDAAGGRPAATIIATTQTAVGLVQAAGQRPGIYTARWWWPAATGNSEAFASRPLWHAEYPFKEGTVVPLAQAPSLDSFKPYGGWQRPTIWQYCGSVQTMGANLDLNVMDDLVTVVHTLIGDEIMTRFNAIAPSLQGRQVPVTVQLNDFNPAPPATTRRLSIEVYIDKDHAGVMQVTDADGKYAGQVGWDGGRYGVVEVDVSGGSFSIGGTGALAQVGIVAVA